jgi:hypothetical protein
MLATDSDQARRTDALARHFQFVQVPDNARRADHVAADGTRALPI